MASYNVGKRSPLFQRHFVFHRIFGEKGRFNWIPDFLFGALEPWLVDNMLPLQIYYIGVLASVDTVFYNRLKKELVSIYSPLSLHRKRSANHLFETIFGPASIKSHFQTLNSYEMYGFLSLLLYWTGFYNNKTLSRP